MRIFDGLAYYQAKELAALAGVNAGTIRRWVQNGNLDHFLFPFRATRQGPVWYRREPPAEGTPRWGPGEPYILAKQIGRAHV